MGQLKSMEGLQLLLIVPFLFTPHSSMWALVFGTGRHAPLLFDLTLLPATSKGQTGLNKLLDYYE